MGRLSCWREWLHHQEQCRQRLGPRTPKNSRLTPLGVDHRRRFSLWNENGCPTSGRICQKWESSTEQDKKRDAARLHALALNPERPELETRDRLAALMGGPGNVDEAVEKCKWDQLQSRTLPCSKHCETGGQGRCLYPSKSCRCCTPGRGCQLCKRRRKT